MSARIFRAVITTVATNQTQNLTLSYLSPSNVDARLGSGSLLVALGFIANGGAMLPAGPANSLFAALQAAQSEDLEYVSVYAYAPYDATGFFEGSWGGGVFGGVAGIVAAPFIAYNMKGDRIKRSVRRGFKRIAGVPDSALGVGGSISPTDKTRADDVATALSGSPTGLFDTLSVTWTNFVETSPVDNVTGKKTGKLFSSETDAVDAGVPNTQYVASPFVTTQNSRKRGRGI